MAKHGSSKNLLVPQSQFHGGPYGRMFRNLPPYDPPGNNEIEKIDFLRELADKMIEARNTILDNEKIPAGYTYFGQFVDHDITFDPTSDLQRQNDPDRLQNFRTPRFDLDNLYGEGPADEPFMYDKINTIDNKLVKLLIGVAKKDNKEDPDEDDLPRNFQDVALIGDHRNDENIFISQLQLGFIKFHNSVIDHLDQNTNVDKRQIFSEAQKFVRWHYQWVVIHDFLKQIAGEEVVESLLPDKNRDPSKPRLKLFDYKKQPFMPVEFSGAAYRFGHSMVRPSYQLNKLVGVRPRIPIFTPDSKGANPLLHFGGFRRLPKSWTIQWDLFLEIDESNPQKSRLIDTKLCEPLTKLPSNVDKEAHSLAFLNLLRGWRLGLPSGQSVAMAMGIPTSDILVQENGADNPLWYYILRESEEQNGGAKLGKVGANIVAEVFIGLLSGDPQSYLNMCPDWVPEFDSEGNNFELRDILRFSGVALTSEDLPFEGVPTGGSSTIP